MRTRRFAERTALLYALVSAIWIVGSDALVALLPLTAQAASLAQTIKGWFFVAASATFLLIVLRSASAASEAEPSAPAGRPRRSWLPLALLAAVFLALAATGSVGFLIVRETASTLTRPTADVADGGAAAAREVSPAVRLRAARRLERAAFAVAGLTLALLATAAGGVALWWRGDRRAVEAEQRMALLERERVAAQALAASEERARRALSEVNLELEARVAARTAELAQVNRELEAANRELDGFASSVSHDLRAPLRRIDGFARLLAEEHAADLDAEAQRLLGVIRGGAARMARLIDDLLGFARASRLPVAPAEVEMEALVDQVLHDLVPAERRASIEIRRGPLPAVRGDPGLLRQVWQNLLSNALKFSGTRERPRIEISASQEGGRILFRVEDNGVGFDPRLAPRLFGVFERLHSEREFEGTGVGLALVASIVARHGGAVGAESGTGEGATFWFWLPAPQRAARATGREDPRAQEGEPR